MLVLRPKERGMLETMLCGILMFMRASTYRDHQIRV